MKITSRQYKRLIAEKIVAERENSTTPVAERKPRTARRKDGSIATKPTISIAYPLPEKQVLEQCLRWLSRRCLCNRLNNGLVSAPDGRMAQYGIKGAGDIICCYKGRHIEIEVKKGKGGRLSLNQQERKADVENHGGIYLIVHNIPELEALWQEEFGSERFEL